MRNHKIYSKAVYIICILVLCISMSSCSAATPTVLPTLTPIPTFVPTLSPMQQEDLDSQAKLALAPELVGTKKIINEIDGLKRVTYIAEASNVYGIETGLYCGEFKKEVIFEGKEVGGVALIPTVVEMLLKGYEESVVIPVGINEINDKTEVDLSLSNVTNSLSGITANNSLLTINTNGKKVSIQNMVVDFEITNQVKTDSRVLPEYFKVGIMPIETSGSNFIPTIYGDFDNKKVFQGKAPFGQKMAETNNRIGLIYIQHADDQAAIAKTIEDKDFLKVGTCFVFLEDLNYYY